jgi:hypothetical protein
MSQSSVVKKGSKLDQIANSYKELTGETIEVGHFQRQGKHYSGLTYPQLLKIWEVGGPNGTGFIKSSKKQFMLRFNKIVEDRKYQSVISQFNEKTHLKSTGVNKFLNMIARIVKEDYKDIFGIRSSPHMPGDTPLYETGDLADNTAYRTSKGRRVTK